MVPQALLPLARQLAAQRLQAIRDACAAHRGRPFELDGVVWIQRRGRVITGLRFSRVGDRYEVERVEPTAWERHEVMKGRAA